METIVSSGGAVAFPDRPDRLHPPFDRESSQPARIRVKPSRAVLVANLAQPKALYTDPFWWPEIGFSRARLGQGATDFAVVKASRDGGGIDTANMAGAVSLLGGFALLPGLRRRCAGAGKVSTFPRLGQHR